MINWIKNRLSKATADEVEESFSPVDVSVNPPVAVRVNPPVAMRVRSADTYVAGYNVDEDELGADDEYSMTVNDIKTTGIDPYDTGHIDKPTARKSVPEK